MRPRRKICRSSAASRCIPCMRPAVFLQNKGALPGDRHHSPGLWRSRELIAPYSPIDQYPRLPASAARLAGPRSGGFLQLHRAVFPGHRSSRARHAFRLIFGRAPLSFLIGAIVVTISLATGIVLGLVAGFSRRGRTSSSCARWICCCIALCCCWPCHRHILGQV